MIESPTKQFTEQMYKKIDEYRKIHLMSWNDFFKYLWISGKGTIDYRKKTGRITFAMVKKLKKKGIDLI